MDKKQQNLRDKKKNRDRQIILDINMSVHVYTRLYMYRRAGAAYR